MYTNYYSILSANPLFKDLNNEELISLLNCAKPIIKSLDENNLLFVEGDIAEYLYIVVSGSINIYKENINGDRHIISNFEQNDILGEVVIFSTINKYPATAIANGNATVLGFNKSIFYTVCGNCCSFHNKLIKNSLTILADKTLVLNKKIELLSTQSIREKIIKYIILLSKEQKSKYIEIPFNREKFAEYLNVTRPSLSRELCKMRDEDLIEFNKNIIKIKKNFN